MSATFSGLGMKRLKRLAGGKSPMTKRDAGTGRFLDVKGSTTSGGSYMSRGDRTSKTPESLSTSSAQRLIIEGVEIEGVVLSTVQGQGLDGADETGYVVRRSDGSVATVLVRTGPEGRTVTVTDLPSGAELMANTPPLGDIDRDWLDAPASGREML